MITVAQSKWNRSLILAITLTVALVAGCRDDGQKRKGQNKDSNERNQVHDPFDDWKAENQPWQEIWINLPEKECSLLFMRRHAHPFLAEYDRKIALRKKGKLSETFALPPNTGGRTNIRVLIVKKGDSHELWLHDMSDEKSAYILNLQTSSFRIEGQMQYWRREGEVYQVGRDVEIPAHAEFIGKIDGSGSGGTLRFISSVIPPESSGQDGK